MWKRSCWASRLFCVFIAAILCLPLFAGCAKSAEDTQSVDDVVFTDALGRQVSVPQSPRRVAALIGSFAEVWLLAGGQLCAAAEDAWDDFGLELGDAVNIGGAHSPSLEGLISANPDLVIASASTASNVEMKDALENMGITVAYFDVDCFEDYLNMLDICTDITGRKDLYRQNGQHIETEIERIKSEVASGGLSQKERTVLLLRASSGTVKAKGSNGTVLGEMLADMGCINIADDNSTLLEDLSIESVIRRDPYRIFVVTMGDDTEKATSNLYFMMEQNPAWGTLSAIKENRLHIMDRRLFNIKPNVRWAEAYETLGKILLETK